MEVEDLLKYMHKFFTSIDQEINDISQELSNVDLEQEDSIEILENTELDINTIDNVDLYTYNIAVKNVLSMLKEKDQIIDLMSERVTLTVDEWKKIKEKNTYNFIEKDIYEQIKQYFENKAKELLNK